VDQSPVSATADAPGLAGIVDMKKGDLGRAARTLQAEITDCRICAPYLPLGCRPVVQFQPSARLLVIGQAPGSRVHRSGRPWDGASGERLRDWLKIEAGQFYDAGRVALLPIGFCYPGVSSNGGDNPPRPECAPLRHDRVRQLLPDIRLTILVGQFAQWRYLDVSRRLSLTDRVRAAASFLPAFLPLPHPSWRSTRWMRRNPWFEDEILHVLRSTVARTLAPPTLFSASGGATLPAALRRCRWPGCAPRRGRNRAR
jgi:uracil-DNA glycosylase